jgi:hypothetical protein
MKWIFTPLILILWLSPAYSQKLTGIWRGYFVQKDFNQLSGRFAEEKYKYEVQINQLSNNSLEGVTYSYRTTVFYGKASFHGIFTRQTKNVLIKEIKMLELKMADIGDACAMTCYLDYSKSGKLEMLSGTFTSTNVKEKTDCGEGTVYLEKVLTSDFAKENFLLKKEHKEIKKTPLVKSNPNNPRKKEEPAVTSKKGTVSQQKEITGTAKTTKKPGTLSKPLRPAVKPGAEDFIVHSPAATNKFIDTASSRPKGPAAGTNTLGDTIPVTGIITAPQKILAVPNVLKERDNNLVKTIELNESEVQIDYYDNGQIDNDTITVYYDNKMVVNHGRLSYSPITLKIHLDEEHPVHEIITVAENLGDVPPNTALMVITAGKKRYEVFIASDEKTNAKVILKYKPKTEVQVH